MRSRYSRRFKSMRGGFLPSSGRARGAYTTFNKIYRSPIGQAVAGAAMTFAKQKFPKVVSQLAPLVDMVKTTPEGVSVVISKGEKSARNIQAPTVYGSYGSITHSIYKDGKYILPKRINAESRITHTFSTSAKISTAVGRQAANAYNFITGSEVAAIQGDLAKMSATVTGQPSSQQAYLANYALETRITNASNLSAFVEIYEIVPRRDILSGANIYLANPYQAWAQGLSLTAPYNSMTATSLNAAYYGNKPFYSELFTQFYLVKKRFPVELPAGATHIHKSQYNICREYNQLLTSTGYFSDGSSQIRGLTHSHLVVLTGNPAHSTTTSTVVSTGNVAIDIVQNANFTAYAVPRSVRVYGSTSTLDILTGVQEWIPAITDQTISNT